MDQPSGSVDKRTPHKFVAYASLFMALNRRLVRGIIAFPLTYYRWVSSLLIVITLFSLSPWLQHAYLLLHVYW